MADSKDKQGRVRRTGEAAKNATVGYGKKIISYETLTKTTEYTASLFSGLLDMSRENRGTRESFESIKRRLGLTEADLGKAHNVHRINFYFGLAGLVISAGFLIKNAIAGGAGFSATISWVGFAIICGCLAFVNSLRCLQIQEHRWASLNEWLAKPGEWAPGKYQPRDEPQAGNTKALPRKTKELRKP